jgi:hypothetical protein
MDLDQVGDHLGTGEQTSDPAQEHLLSAVDFSQGSPSAISDWEDSR